MDRNPRDLPLKAAAALTLASSLVLNPWALGALLTADGEIGWIGYRILLWAVAAVAAAAGAWGLLRPAEKLRRDAQSLTLALAAFLVAALLAELLLRLTPGPVFHPSLHLYPHREITMRVDVPGVSEIVTIRTNRWGLRGDPVPADWAGRPTVVAVGGSTTKCSFLSDEKTWPSRLQVHLRTSDPRVVVQNAGLTGHSTKGHLLLMNKVVTRIRPTTVLFLVGMNDLAVSLNQADAERYYRSPGLHYTVFSRSRVVQLAYAGFRILVNRAPVEIGEGADKKRFELRPLTDPDPLPDDLTELVPSLPLFETNVRELVRRARRAGIDPVFATQPLLFGDGEEWDVLQGTSFWFGEQDLSISAATYWRLLELFNHKLLDVCAQEDVPCFDLASHVPHERRYFYDEMHFTEAGAERVARELATFLRAEGVLERTR